MTQDVPPAEQWLQQHGTIDPPERAKSMQTQMTIDKQSVETWQKHEADWQAKDIEAQSQLRDEQSKLGEANLMRVASATSQQLGGVSNSVAALVKPRGRAHLSR
jgi:hypothetical protein